MVKMLNLCYKKLRNTCGFELSLNLRFRCNPQPINFLRGTEIRGTYLPNVFAPVKPSVLQFPVSSYEGRRAPLSRATRFYEILRKPSEEEAFVSRTSLPFILPTALGSQLCSTEIFTICQKYWNIAGYPSFGNSSRKLRRKGFELWLQNRWSTILDTRYPDAWSIRSINRSF